MKKSSIIKICIAGIAFVLILGGFIILQSRSATIPYFEFLKEPKPFVKNIEYKKGKHGARDTKYYYAFETDYNDFYARAFAELKTLKFIPGPDNLYVHSVVGESPSYEPSFEEAEWYYRDWNKLITVIIYHNYKLSDEEKTIKKQHPGLVYAKGFVTVYINHCEGKKQNKLVAIFKKFLDKFREPAE